MFNYLINYIIKIRVSHFEARSEIGKLKMEMDKTGSSHLDRCKRTKLAMDLKLGLIHSYNKRRFIDCSVSKWTIPRGIS